MSKTFGSKATRAASTRGLLTPGAKDWKAPGKLSMRRGEIERVANRIDAAGRPPHEILVDAVDTGITMGLTAPEIVALVDLLEVRLDMRLHPVRFD